MSSQRNDAPLYSGMSRSIERTIARREQIRDAKRNQASALKPAETKLRDFIDNQRVDQMKKLASIVEIDTKESDIKSEIRAIKKNLEFIDSFKRMVDTMLRLRETDGTAD